MRSSFHHLYAGRSPTHDDCTFSTLPGLASRPYARFCFTAPDASAGHRRHHSKHVTSHKMPKVYRAMEAPRAPQVAPRAPVEVEQLPAPVHHVERAPTAVTPITSMDLLTAAAYEQHHRVELVANCWQENAPLPANYGVSDLVGRHPEGRANRQACADHYSGKTQTQVAYIGHYMYDSAAALYPNIDPVSGVYHQFNAPGHPPVQPAASASLTPATLAAAPPHVLSVHAPDAPIIDRSYG